MTRDDIIAMAREAGFETLMPSEHIHGTGGVYVGDDDIAGMLERFAALLAAAEREACAKLCEAEAEKWEGKDGPVCFEVRLCSDAIRARGEK